MQWVCRPDYGDLAWYAEWMSWRCSTPTSPDTAVSCHVLIHRVFGGSHHLLCSLDMYDACKFAIRKKIV